MVCGAANSKYRFDLIKYPIMAAIKQMCLFGLVGGC